MCNVGKSDALDAEAICEAVSRPTMRFATIKTAEQQAVLTLHRARELLVKQQTMLANLIRGCLGDSGSWRLWVSGEFRADRRHQ